jgi:GntR family transcriptional regulator
VPAPAVAEALQLELGRPGAEGGARAQPPSEGPLSHITTWVPDWTIARRLRRASELSKKPILVLLEESGVKVGRASRPSPRAWPTQRRSPAPGRAVGSALLAVRRLIYDDDDRPVQWLHGLYRPDRYTYEMQLSRVGSIDAKVWVSKDVSAQFN